MVLVTTGSLIMEQIIKAKDHLCIILAEPYSGAADSYMRTKAYFQQASDQGLVEMVDLDEELKVEHGSPVLVHRPAKSLVKELEVEVLDDDKKSCLLGCCTS